MMTSGTALLTAVAVHFGFQATVTALVYPALARVPAAGWAAAHRAHSRAITPLVAAVYLALLATGAWTVLSGGRALLSGPDRWTLVALAATGVALLITAVVAAPAHGRLGDRHDPAGVARLLRADRFRAAAAAVALAAQILAVW